MGARRFGIIQVRPSTRAKPPLPLNVGVAVQELIERKVIRYRDLRKLLEMHENAKITMSIETEPP